MLWKAAQMATFPGIGGRGHLGADMEALRAIDVLSLRCARGFFATLRMTGLCGARSATARSCGPQGQG